MRVKTSILKYINLLRSAKNNNETIEFPGGAREMIIQARRARQMIQVIPKPTPNLSDQEKKCFNSIRSGEICSDEAYKMN